jgi:hypothetical protein
MNESLSATRISDLPSLRDQPELYPGDWSTGNNGYLHSSGYSYPLKLSPGQSLADATITLDDGATQSGGFEPSLSMYLEQIGAIDVDRRHPVVAVGSNAYARQISDKFAGAACDDTIPLFPCTTDAISVCFCPFYASKGYVPATASKGRGRFAHVWLQLLTDEQLKLMTATEGGYDLVWVANEESGLTILASGLPSGQVIPGFYTYWYRQVLTLHDDSPLHCAWAHAEMKEGAMTEAEVLQAISGLDIKSLSTQNDMPPQNCQDRTKD